MDPEPSSFLMFFQIIFFVAGGIAAIVGIFAGIKTLARKPPIEAEFATKKELWKLRSELVQDMTSFRAEIKTAVNEIGREVKDLISSQFGASEERARRLHARIDIIAGMVSEIKGRCQAFHGGKES
jgi:hypothetical protein